MYFDDLYAKYPELEKWIKSFNCIIYSENAIAGNPEVLRIAKYKFLHIGCGVTCYNNNVLLVDINNDGKMQEVFDQMLQMVTPENYSIKGENYKEFFTPFEDRFQARNWGNSEYFKKLLRNSPKDAAIDLLAESQFKHSSIWGKYGIARCAKKFNEFYNDWKSFVLK